MLDYDDDRTLGQYIQRNRSFFMTPFEQRAEQLGIMREKARHRIRESPGAPPEWTIEALGGYDAQVDDAILNAIGDNLDSLVRFHEKVSSRINVAFASGQLRPNRCPVCNRIVETPEARQCLWCWHDWHNAEP